MNKNITISVDEYKELLLKERPSENDKWLLGKIKEFIINNCEINNELYFTLDNAKDIYNKYDEIFKKYSKMYIKSFNDRRIEELKKEIKMEKLRALKEASKEVKENE